MLQRADEVVASEIMMPGHQNFKINKFKKGNCEMSSFMCTQLVLGEADCAQEIAALFLGFAATESVCELRIAGPQTRCVGGSY